MTRDYKAFSWSDRAWGEWLHRTLETYHTPKALVGKETPVGPAPRRLHPIFKDREEEAAGHGIGAAIEEALDHSEFLIVLCSPRSAKSKWVNREIAYFKTHRDPKKILALIVDGEPGASAMPGRETEECFPEALTHKVDANLQPTQEPEDTPLAADARKTGDGKRLAKLKLAAAMIGVGLDDLVQRDERRRAVRRRWVTSGMAASMVLLSGLTLFAFQQRDAAQQAQTEAEEALQNAIVQYGQAESLIEYMIGDLRHKLQQEVQLKVLADIATRAQDYYDKQVTIRIDDDGLGRRARVLSLLSDLEQDFGNSDKAVRLAKESLGASKALLDRAPDDPKRLLDHAHSLQGLGRLAYQLGDTEDAERLMREAVDFTSRLSALDEDNDDWRAEYGSALANLGIIQLQQRQLENAATNLFKAESIRSVFAQKSPEDWHGQYEHALSLAWLAEALLQSGRHLEAIENRIKEDHIYANLLRNNPDDHIIKSLRVVNKTKRAESLLLTRSFVEAQNLAETAVSIAQEMFNADPTKTNNLSDITRARLVLSEIAFLRGDLLKARQEALLMLGYAEKLASVDQNRIEWSGELQGRARILFARIEAFITTDTKSCIRSLHSINNEAARLKALLTNHPTQFKLAHASTRAEILRGDLEMLLKNQNEANVAWEKSAEILNRAAGHAGPPKDLASQKLIAELDARRKGGVDYVLKTVCGLSQEAASKPPGEPAERD